MLPQLKLGNVDRVPQRLDRPAQLHCHATIPVADSYSLLGFERQDEDGYVEFLGGEEPISSSAGRAVM